MTSTDIVDQLFAASRASEAYIDDNGFSAAVIARLPAQKSVPFWKEALITLTFTLIGCVFALYFFPVEELVSNLPTSVVISPLSIAGLAAFITLVSGSAYWAAETDHI